MSDKKKEEVVVLNASSKNKVYVWLIDEKMYFVGTYEELNDGIRKEFDSIKKLGKAYIHDKNFYDKKNLKWNIKTKTAETFKKEQDTIFENVNNKVEYKYIKCGECGTFAINIIKKDKTDDQSLHLERQTVYFCNCYKEEKEYPDCLPDSFVADKKDDIEIWVHRGYICPECLKPYIIVDVKSLNVITESRKFKVPSCTCK